MSSARLPGCTAAALLAVGCAGFADTAPQTYVVLDNDYAPSTSYVLYDAHWSNVSFGGEPIPPGASSPAQDTVPASANNTAYVLVARGWDQDGAVPPTSFVLLQSRSGFAIALGDTLHIPVDDDHFEGNCAAGAPLTQDEANFLAQVVFSGEFGGLAYDASRCTVIQPGDAGAD